MSNLKEFCQEYPVYYWDIDGNQHVNNTVCVRWIEETFRNYVRSTTIKNCIPSLQKIHVKYFSQLKEGEIIICQITPISSLKCVFEFRIFQKETKKLCIIAMAANTFGNHNSDMVEYPFLNFIEDTNDLKWTLRKSFEIQFSDLNANGTLPLAVIARLFQTMRHQYRESSKMKDAFILQEAGYCYDGKLLKVFSNISCFVRVRFIGTFDFVHEYKLCDEKNIDETLAFGFTRMILFDYKIQAKVAMSDESKKLFEKFEGRKMLDSTSSYMKKFYHTFNDDHVMIKNKM